MSGALVNFYWATHRWALCRKKNVWVSVFMYVEILNTFKLFYVGVVTKHYRLLRDRKESSPVL